MGQRLDNAKSLYLEAIRDGRVSEAINKYSGHRYTQHISQSLIGGATWRASERYEFQAFFEYDFRRRDTVQSTLTVIRNFHRWSCFISLDVDEGERDNVEVSVRFGPRDLWNALRRERAIR